MDIRGLGYIVIDVADTDAWRSYAEMLGMMVVDDGDALRLRIDDRPFRVLVRPTDGPEGLAAAGWELPDAAALAVAAAELDTAGFSVEHASAEEAAGRRVGGLVRTTDPGGASVELFHGPILDHVRFVSPTGISGFVTDGLGLGHIVLGTPAPEDDLAFYTDVLGFRVSDVWRPGRTTVTFLHCNPRHHSLALVAAREPALYHFMVEAGTLDDVGSTLDLHHQNGTPLAMDLGKHTNDHMVSFYSRSPSGFDVEFGCGGRLVDDETWTVTEITAPSFWGHRRPATD